MERSYILSVTRGSLIEVERGISGFAVDATSYDHAPYLKREYAKHVADVLQNPDAIFGGLERENFDDAICYSTSPGGWTETGHAFLAFAIVDTVVNQIVVFDWELRAADSLHAGRPMNWETDLGEPLWTLMTK